MKLRFNLSTLTVIIFVLRIAEANVGVHGARGGILSSGQRPFRRNIEDFQNSGPAWDLYIQALRQFMDRNETRRKSFFQIAGIHGLPFIPWDGVAGQNENGYATHSSILFGPWHRAHIALYEQIINTIARKIANTYSENDKETYQDAALTLRVPYWDWASRALLPDVITQRRLVINSPTGRIEIDNPLYSYKFHTVPGNGFPTEFGISHYPETVRQPDKDGNSQHDMINSVLASNFDSNRDRVYTLLASYGDYAPFSNTAYDGDLRGDYWDSLEGVHNGIHGIVGGYGHMGYVPYSCFDPIFWLHHTNIDRLDAIWSAINPDSYVIPQVNGAGTFWEAPGSVENVDTPLTPFRLADGSGYFHTAMTAKLPRTFGYAYPEIVDWGVTPAQLSANVRTAVKELYDTSVSAEKSVRRNIQSYATPQRRDWYINLKLDKHCLGGPYSVHFFIGKPPTDCMAWRTASNLVSSYYVSAGLPGRTKEQPLFGQLPLTKSLRKAVKQGSIHGLEPEDVTDFLQSHLHWRVQKADGTEVDPDEVNTLHVAVVEQVVEPSDRPDEFGKYGKPCKHPDLEWKGRAAGHTD